MQIYAFYLILSLQWDKVLLIYKKNNTLRNEENLCPITQVSDFVLNFVLFYNNRMGWYDRRTEEPMKKEHRRETVVVCRRLSRQPSSKDYRRRKQKKETTLRGDGTGASHTTALKDKTAIGGNCTLSFFFCIIVNQDRHLRSGPFLEHNIFRLFALFFLRKIEK